MREVREMLWKWYNVTHLHTINIFTTTTTVAVNVATTRHFHRHNHHCRHHHYHYFVHRRRCHHLSQHRHHFTITIVITGVTITNISTTVNNSIVTKPPSDMYCIASLSYSTESYNLKYFLGYLFCHSLGVSKFPLQFPLSCLSQRLHTWLVLRLVGGK